MRDNEHALRSLCSAAVEQSPNCCCDVFLRLTEGYDTKAFDYKYNTDSHWAETKVESLRITRVRHEQCVRRILVGLPLGIRTCCM
jgi:hypothetical protein